MRRSAFTLTELLIVIAVIMILLGLLFPALRMIQLQAMKTKAASELGIIKAACELYKNINGAYPDCADPGQTPNMSTVFTTGTPPNVTVNKWSLQLDWTTVANQLVARLQMVDRDHFTGTSPLATLHDPWKQLYRYRPPQYYPYAGPAGPGIPPIDSTTPPNQDTCQLWSCGPNMVDEAGQNGSGAIGLSTTQIPDDIFLKN